MSPLTSVVCDLCGRSVPWHWHTIRHGRRVCGDCSGTPRPRPHRPHQRLTTTTSKEQP